MYLGRSAESASLCTWTQVDARGALGGDDRLVHPLSRDLFASVLSKAAGLTRRNREAPRDAIAISVRTPPMSRTALGRSAAPRLAFVGAVLLALGLAVAGCSDDTPRTGSADTAASRKAAAKRGGGLLDLGRRSADVAPTRTRGKGIAGRSAGPPVKTQGQTR